MGKCTKDKYKFSISLVHSQYYLSTLSVQNMSYRNKLPQGISTNTY